MGNNVLKFGGEMYNIREKAILAKNISKSSYYSAKAIEYSEKAAQFGDVVTLSNVDKWVNYEQKARYFENLSQGFNVKFFGIGTVFSIGIGAYCTHNFCENLINKFAEYYQNNAEKITNSYNEAISYFTDLYKLL